MRDDQAGEGAVRARLACTRSSTFRGTRDDAMRSFTESGLVAYGLLRRVT